MGKNDVELVISAKEAVSPGIEAAQKKILAMQDKAAFAGEMAARRQTEREVNEAKRRAERIIAEQDKAALAAEVAADRASRKAAEKAQVMTGNVIKLGAALAGIQGGMQVASSAIAAFSGNSEAAMSALERLPLGIGSVVREFNTLVQALNAADERARIFGVTMEDLKAKLRSELIAPRKGVLADIERADISASEKIKAIEDERKKANEKVDARQAASQNRVFNERVELVVQQLKAEKKAIEESYVERDRLLSDSLDKEFKTRQKAYAEQAEKERRTRIEAEMETQRKLANISGMAAAARFGQAADFGNILAGPGNAAQSENDQIEEAIRRARGSGGASQLAGGTQDRFGTGLAASARESAARMASETAKNTEKTVEKLENIRKLLEDANKPPAVPGINLETLEGLT